MPRIARILPEKVFFSFWPEVTITNGFFIVAKILNMKIEPFPFLLRSKDLSNFNIYCLQGILP